MSQTRPAVRPVTALGGGIAALAVVIAVVFGVLYETGTAPFSDGAESGEAAITAATETWVDAMNSQEVERMRDSVCTGDRAKFDGQEDQEPVAEPVRVDSVDDIAVDGDTATATLTASVGAGAKAQTQDFPLGFRLEDGTWRVCQSAGTAQTPG